MLGEFGFEYYIPIEKNDDDEANLKNINVNWTLQIIFFLFTLVVGMVIGNLILALTVNKLDEVIKKGEIHQTLKKTSIIVTYSTLHRVEDTVKGILQRKLKKRKGQETEIESKTETGDTAWASLCVFVNDNKKRKHDNFLMRKLASNQDSDEDNDFAYKLFFYNLEEKKALQDPITVRYLDTGIVLRPGPVRSAKKLYFENKRLELAEKKDSNLAKELGQLHRTINQTKTDMTKLFKLSKCENENNFKKIFQIFKKDQPSQDPQPAKQVTI